MERDRVRKRVHVQRELEKEETSNVFVVQIFTSVKVEDIFLFRSRIAFQRFVQTFPRLLVSCSVHYSVLGYMHGKVEANSFRKTV